VIFIDGGEFFTSYAARKLSANLLRLQKSDKEECFGCGQKQLFGKTAVIVIAGNRRCSQEVTIKTIDGNRAAFYQVEADSMEHHSLLDYSNPEHMLTQCGEFSFKVF
jgi:hypothetical protein